MYKIWLDDIRSAPNGFIWCKSVNSAIETIMKLNKHIELIDLDHDLGDFANDGGDGIKLLDWLIEFELFCQVRLHTMNPVGKQNMQRLINRYWK